MARVKEVHGRAKIVYVITDLAVAASGLTSVPPKAEIAAGLFGAHRNLFPHLERQLQRHTLVVPNGDETNLLVFTLV